MIHRVKLEDVTKNIFDDLKLNPSNAYLIANTKFGMEIYFGRFRIRVYGIDDKDVTQLYHDDVAKAKDFDGGLNPGEYYFKQGMFTVSQSKIGWYAIESDES